MHMLLISLSTIYQGRVPILQYGQRHVDQQSRAHLRYFLTGEKAMCIDNLVTYISDPNNYEYSEPYCKSYRDGGTDIPEQELVRKTSKRKKTQQIVQETPSTHHTHQNNNPNIHNVGYPMQDLPQDYQDIDDPPKHETHSKPQSAPYLVETTHPPPQP